MAENSGVEFEELRALSTAPSRRVCSFKSMTSYGSHYRVDMEEGGALHVTFDCGVAELQNSAHGNNSTGQGGAVDLVRVGILKDILVLNYGRMYVVLMVVSWVARHTDAQPRLCRDAHGFWLANMAAVPRCTLEPYIMPSLASQVRRMCRGLLVQCCAWRVAITDRSVLKKTVKHVQVFFVADKAMPGWSVVLKKEARGRRITSTGMEHCLGQEESNGDTDVFSRPEGERREGGDENNFVEATSSAESLRRRRLQ